MPCLPPNETARLEALARYAILDSAPEASFDRITTLAARLFEAPIALITLVDRTRQWFKSCVGYDGTETSREVAFCAHTILTDDVLIVPDATLDPRFSDNPRVTGGLKIRFYAGAPLVTADGFRLGSLCVVDMVPRSFNPAQSATLRELAALVIDAFEARRTAHRMADEIAARQCAETAVQQARERAEEARAEAERANNAKSEFLSRMSHELRTPLNAILGYGQLLEFSTLKPQDARAVGSILEGGRHLLSLVDEVLDLARVESAEFQLSSGHVDIGHLVGECMGLVARLAEARGITCEIRLPEDAATSFWVDEQRLRQVLLNLLSNAIKYNRHGGTVLAGGTVLPSGGLRLEVSDTGSGIPAEEISCLFVPFKRLQQTSDMAEGTGLGLVISQQIARAMGGSIGVESVVDRGSTFWIELPPAPDGEKRGAAAASNRSEEVPAQAHRNATLLYIEDNASNLEVMEMLLASRRPSWHLLSATDGRTGLQRVPLVLPDLILLDLQLPDMSGDEVLAELRRDPAVCNIPVIILSADATSRSREGVLAGGANDYISKPFQVDTLLERIDRTLRQCEVA